MGAAREVTTEGGGGPDSFSKFLPRGSSGGAIFWGGYMGAFGANGAEVRGGACGIPAAGHKGKVKAAEDAPNIFGAGLHVHLGGIHILRLQEYCRGLSPVRDASFFKCGGL